MRHSLASPLLTVLLLLVTTGGTRAGDVRTIVVDDWADPGRGDRRVPAKIYLPPEESTGPFPVIVFSHGLGGSRDGYGYLGQHWASRGYVSVHVQHLGSDVGIFQGVAPADRRAAMEKAFYDRANLLDRPRDARFAIDRLTKLNADPASPLYGRLDLERVGVSGHSFGAYTTLAVAGQTSITPANRELRLADPRVKAALAMSPTPPRQPERSAELYNSIRVPLMVMTGTDDRSPIDPNVRPVDRQLSFRHAGGVAHLLVLTGGDHGVFGGPRRAGQERANDAAMHELILRGSTAFWDAYLKVDADAKRFLVEGGYAKAVGESGTVEQR